MAGIGFEIKKIYDKNSISHKFSGFLYTSFVSIGPSLICILMLLFVREITAYYDVAYMTRETLNSAILYAFVFSLIFVSGTTMVLSRYISDGLYMGKIKAIFSSLVGMVGLTLLCSGSIGLVFYMFSPLDLVFKVLSYLMYIELSVIFVFMVYISAIKDYKKISIAFSLGLVVTILSSLLLIHVLNVAVVRALLVAIDLGFLINIVLILRALEAVFDPQEARYFEFVAYIYKMPKLFFINFFYTLGLFVHNFVFWIFSDLNIVIEDTFVSAPVYDMATFYSVLTILPATVFFVLKVETSFYVKYKSFLMTIVNGGSLKDLKKARSNMAFLIKEEMSFIMELQLLITVLLVVVLTQLVFPYFGVATIISELFTYIAFGYYSAFMAFLITTILLYFNAQSQALAIQACFVISNTLFSYITIVLGQEYYGLGIVASGTLTLTLALVTFARVIRNIDYMVFSQQPLINTQKHIRIDRWMHKLYDKE